MGYLYRSLVLAFCLLMAMPLAAEKDEWAVEDDGTPYTRLSLGVELGGPAIFASSFLSFRPFEYIALNGGVGYFGISGISSSNGGGESLSVFVFPAHLSFLYGLTHSLEILAGVDIVAVSGDLNSTGSLTDSLTGEQVIPVAGIGYRYSSNPSGFFFRITGYVIIGKQASVSCVDTSCVTTTSSSVLPWAGITMGYSFFSAEKPVKEDEFDYDDDY